LVSFYDDEIKHRKYSCPGEPLLSFELTSGNCKLFLTAVPRFLGAKDGPFKFVLLHAFNKGKNGFPKPLNTAAVNGLSLKDQQCI